MCGEYTQRDSDSARGGIEQLPDHLSISLESAPVRLGESVRCAGCRSESKPGQSLCSFSTFPFSFLLFLASHRTGIVPPPWRRRIERKIRRSFHPRTTLLLPIHFPISPVFPPKTGIPLLFPFFLSFTSTGFYRCFLGVNFGRAIVCHPAQSHQRCCSRRALESVSNGTNRIAKRSGTLGWAGSVKREPSVIGGVRDEIIVSFRLDSDRTGFSSSPLVSRRLCSFHAMKAPFT